MPALSHGMSAEVIIDEPLGATGVVRVPVQAVGGSLEGQVCYVKGGKEIQKRKVVVGLRGAQFMEIQSGIQEGNVVLDDLDNALEGLAPLLLPPDTPPKK
jgi:multidrug efflux pump subunit AcrA (membrane-fusion protein)